MLQLNLKEFRCLEETDEVGSDSPYFCVFIGQRDGSMDLVVVRDKAWDNDVDSGEKHSAFMRVGVVDSNSVVLVALLEEDYNPDLVQHGPQGSNLTSLRNKTSNLWSQLRSGGNYSAANIRGVMKMMWAPLVAQSLENDELVAVGGVKITSNPGDLPLLYMNGDGGRYKVRFNTSS